MDRVEKRNKKVDAHDHLLEVGRIRRIILFVSASISGNLVYFAFAQSSVKPKYWDPILKWFWDPITKWYIEPFLNWMGDVELESPIVAAWSRLIFEVLTFILYFHGLACFTRSGKMIKSFWNYSGRGVVQWLAETTSFWLYMVAMNVFVENAYDVVLWFSLCFHLTSLLNLVFGYARKGLIFDCLLVLLVGQGMIHFDFQGGALWMVLAMYQGVKMECHLDTWIRNGVGFEKKDMDVGLLRIGEYWFCSVSIVFHICITSIDFSSTGVEKPPEILFLYPFLTMAIFLFPTYLDVEK